MYFFAFVWLGFLFCFENTQTTDLSLSFTGDLARGYRGRVYSFLIAGWV